MQIKKKKKIAKPSAWMRAKRGALRGGRGGKEENDEEEGEKKAEEEEKREEEPPKSRPTGTPTKTFRPLERVGPQATNHNPVPLGSLAEFLCVLDQSEANT